MHKLGQEQWFESKERRPVTQPAGLWPRVLIFQAEERRGAENVKTGGSLRGMECWVEERRDEVEREVGILGSEMWAMFEGHV